jgi:hypothetical protein
MTSRPVASEVPLDAGFADGPGASSGAVRSMTGYTQDTLERGIEADRLTDARWACPAGAGSNSYPVCGGGSGYEQASAKLRCIDSDEVAVAFGPPA